MSYTPTPPKSFAASIPEIWAKKLNAALRKTGVMMQVVSQDYEGEIARKGDTVHISSLSNLTVSDYVRDTDITVQKPDSTVTTLTINKEKYVSVELEDISAIQQDVIKMAELIDECRYEISAARDLDIMATAFPTVDSGNQLGTVDFTVVANVYPTFLKLAQKLKESGALKTMSTSSLEGAKSVKPEGWVVVNPAVMSQLLQSPQYITLDKLGSQAIPSGAIGKIAGLWIYESSNLPVETDTVNILAGVPSALQFAGKMVKSESVRDPKRFRDIFKCLYIWGQATTKPKGLASCVAKVA